MKRVELNDWLADHLRLGVGALLLVPGLAHLVADVPGNNFIDRFGHLVANVFGYINYLPML